MSEDLQAAADREAARVAAIRAQRGSSALLTNQGQGAGNRQREAGNDTDLREIERGLTPDLRRRFAAAQRQAGLSAATVNEEGQVGPTGDTTIDAQIAAINRDKGAARDATRTFGEYGVLGSELVVGVTAIGLAGDVSSTAGIDPMTGEWATGWKEQGAGVVAVFLPVGAKQLKLAFEVGDEALDAAKAAKRIPTHAPSSGAGYIGRERQLPAPSTPRVSGDVSVSPSAPAPLATTRPIGESATQQAQLQADIAAARAQGARNIRVNQQQLDAAGKRVGKNRPDLQYTRPDGTRVHIEYDTPSSGRGLPHANRLLANDPESLVETKTIK